MFCRKCGTKMSDDAAFCPECGARVVRVPASVPSAPETPAEAPAAASIPSAPETPAEAPAAVSVPSAPETPAEVPAVASVPSALETPAAAPVYPETPAYPAAVAAPADAWASVPNPETSAPRKKSKAGLVVLIVLLAVLLLGAAVGGFFLWRGLSAGRGLEPDPENYPLFYLTEEGELFCHAPNWNEPVFLADGYGTEEYEKYRAVYGASASDDGKTIAYLRNYLTEYFDAGEEEQGEVSAGDLYLHREKRGKKDGEDLLVAERVRHFRLSNDGEMLWYATREGIYAYSVKKEESVKLDSQSGYFTHSFGSDRLLYSKMGDEGTDYYVVDFTGKEPEKKKLDSSISQINSVSEDLTCFFYSKYHYDVETETGTTDVYYIGESGEKQKLLSGDIGVTYADAETGKVIYTERRESGITAGEFIQDDMIDIDAVWEEPRTEDFKVTREGFFGGTYTVTDYDAYNEAWEEYEQKLFRDELRTVIEENDWPIYVSDLICLENGARTVLAEEIDYCQYYDEDISLLVYRKSDLNSIQTVALLSQIESSDDVYSYISQAQYARPARVCALKEGLEPVTLFENTGDGYEDIVFEEDGFYLLRHSGYGEEAESMLWYVPVSETSVGPAAEVDGEASSLVFGKVCGQSAYYRQREDGASALCDLYLLEGASGTLLFEGMQTGGIFEPAGPEGCYFSPDYDWDRQYGELYFYGDEGQPRWVASDVNSVWVREGVSAYLLKDYAGERGDLYFCEDGDRMKLVDYDVAAVSSYSFAQYN